MCGRAKRGETAGRSRSRWRRGERKRCGPDIRREKAIPPAARIARGRRRTARRGALRADRRADREVCGYCARRRVLAVWEYARGAPAAGAPPTPDAAAGAEKPENAASARAFLTAFSSNV